MKKNEEGLPLKYKKILLYVEQGMRPREIAQKMDMDYTWICKVLAKPEVLAAQHKMHEKAVDAARAIFEKHAVQAAIKIVKIAKTGAPDSRVQLDAAKEILYQIGLKPVEVIETRKREYTPEEIASAAKVTGEVEQILNRLGGEKSPFVLENTPEDDAPPIAPVPIEGGEVVESNTSTDTTGGTGQATVPEEPVLPVQGDTGV